MPFYLFLCAITTQFMKVINNSFERLSLTVRKTIGTLRSDNGDVHENVAEKQTSHHFKLFHDYPNSPCYFKRGGFWLKLREGNALKFGQRWQILSPCRSRSQVDLKFGHFMSQLCSEGKEMYKKACRVVVLLIKPIVFLTYPLPSSSWFGKVPNISDQGAKFKQPQHHRTPMLYIQ